MARPRFNEAASHQGGVSDQHRQATADLVHLRRNAGTEIMITAVCMQLGRSGELASKPRRSGKPIE
jgi:hypothetical protein